MGKPNGGLIGDCIGGVLATSNGVLVPDVDIGADAIVIGMCMGGVACPIEL